VTGTYDSSTSLLRVKVQYLKTIEGQNHDIKITLDPYKMSVAQKSFNFQAAGVNFKLTFDTNPELNTFVLYGFIAVSGLIVLAALVFTLLNYKMAAVELLLSAQMVYFGFIACGSDNLSMYPLSGLRYLVGFNTLKQFDINRFNFDTPFLLSSYTFAEFLLNFNIMAAVLVLVILIVFPLNINVWYKLHKRTKSSSPEMK